MLRQLWAACALRMMRAFFGAVQVLYVQVQEMLLEAHAGAWIQRLQQHLPLSCARDVLAGLQFILKL